MTSLNLASNPFKVFTPEDMEAEDAYKLFVDPFTDFSKIREPGHAMINGPRGCGKSMIFRYLLPDCQCLAHNTTVDKLPFLAFLISIKNTVPNVTEFQRLLNQHADLALNEHLLAMFVASKVFRALCKLPLKETPETKREAAAYYREEYCARLTAAGASKLKAGRGLGVARLFGLMADTCDQLYGEITQYAKRLAFPEEGALRYSGVLSGYVDSLFPLLRALKRLSFLPSGPTYLLIDDADYLSATQTKVLNSWVSTRTQAEVSIKISTQLRYKTFATVSGLPIQSPHDYYEINVADVYTSRRGRYLNRVEAIITKRLERADLPSSPYAFFPSDAGQEGRVQEFAEKIKAQWSEKKRGYRPDDDVARYARPEYIKSLGGPSKSTSTYSYAGFAQLVHISSGLIRYFLEPAALMFDDERSRSSNGCVTSIRPGIQDSVIRAEADNLMLSEFDKILKEEVPDGVESDAAIKRREQMVGQLDRLRNLIQARGGIFFLKLVSDDAERRVFSVAISGQPDPDVIKVFDLGVQYGYFQRSSIGNKDGTGRTRLYVLTRRLAPYFKLDPSSFAGYLWVTNDLLREGIENPDRVLRRIKKDGTASSLESAQLTLFE